MKSNFKKLIIDIKIHDLNRAVDFYKNVLGLGLIHKESEWASFGAVGAEVHLYMHGGAECGLEFRVVNINKEVQILKNKGVKFFIEQDRPDFIGIVSDEVMECSWGKMSLFRDSEGNQLALIEE